jgi:hypothetical protein
MKLMSNVVHLRYSLSRDEDGVWCASAQLGDGIRSVGYGRSDEDAVADLRAALETLLAQTDPPPEIRLTLSIA